MNSWRRLLPVFCLLILTATASAQVAADKALATMTVSDGLELSLWASEPLFVNPTCIDVDHRGRVWVCESINYRSRLRGQPLREPKGDRIVILEDSQKTGKADKVTVFYQSPEVLAPLGIAVAKNPTGPGYKVYVCQSPDIWLFEDADGDGKADGPPEKFLTGFKGFDHDHGVHGILLGPDGRLYFSVGDQGVDGLASRTPPGEKPSKVWKTNNTDLRAGTIWRCNLDGTGLELIAHNFRNEYEPCVSSFGDVFVSDNDDDGNQQTRICHVFPGGNYGYHPRGKGESHWHEEQPGVLPKILRTYFGSPTGMCFYEGSLLPAKFQGQPWHTDAGPRHVRCYRLKPQGASYAVERDDVVQSTDNWFRPSDVCVAPDGSLLVADWYDPGVGGHGMGDVTRGRIFRLAPKGHQSSTPEVDVQSKDGLLKALASPALSVRYMAIAALNTMSAEQAAPLLESAATQKDDPYLRARALWQLGRKGKLNLVHAALEDADPRFRTLAIRILKDFHNHTPDEFTPEAKKALLADPSAGVRREALLAMRDVPAAKCGPFILELAQRAEAGDRFYIGAVGIAVGTDPKRRDVILADFVRHFPEWDAKTADLVWELRPATILPTLGKKLVDATLPATDRARIVDILAASDSEAAGSAMLAVLRENVPTEVRTKAVENLKLFLPGKWQSLRQSDEFKRTLNELMRPTGDPATGLALIAAAGRVGDVGRAANLASDTKTPPTVRRAAVEALGALPSVEAVKALVGLLGDKELSAAAVNALAQHLADRGERPGSKEALAVLLELVSDKERTAELRLASVSALAGTRPGTILLLDLHGKGELAEELKADTARLLRNSPYQDLRNRAMIAFPPPGRLDPKKLPSVASLATRKGDAVRGRQVLAASAKNDMQCLKCHTVRGAGGSIGPDLSMIGKKASRENLIESILLPSKAIADQYLTWIVETKKGLALSGLLVEETADYLILRDANGKDTRIEKKDLESKEKGPNSLMPNDLLAYMTADDVVDLTEYLLTLKTPMLAMDYWHIVGPFPNGPNDAGLDTDFGPETGVDLKASYKGKSGSVAWRTVKPDGQGYVDLQAFLGAGSSDATSYLWRAFESPVEQEATILLGPDDGAKLFVNGVAVYTDRRHRAAVPEADAVKVKLKPGRNEILLKIVNGDGPHGFYLTVAAEQELKRLEGK